MKVPQLDFDEKYIKQGLNKIGIISLQNFHKLVFESVLYRLEIDGLESFSFQKRMWEIEISFSSPKKLKQLVILMKRDVQLAKKCKTLQVIESAKRGKFNSVAGTKAWPKLVKYLDLNFPNQSTNFHASVGRALALRHGRVTPKMVAIQLNALEQKLLDDKNVRPLIFKLIGDSKKRVLEKEFQESARAIVAEQNKLRLAEFLSNFPNNHSSYSSLWPLTEEFLRNSMNSTLVDFIWNVEKALSQDAFNRNEKVPSAREVFDFVEEFEKKFSITERKRYFILVQLLAKTYSDISAVQKEMREYVAKLRMPMAGEVVTEPLNKERIQSTSYADRLEEWYSLHTGGER